MTLNIKRILSFLLALVLTISLLPMPGVFAEEDSGEPEEEISEDISEDIPAGEIAPLDLDEEVQPSLADYRVIDLYEPPASSDLRYTNLYYSGVYQVSFTESDYLDIEITYPNNGTHMNVKLIAKSAGTANLQVGSLLYQVNVHETRPPAYPTVEKTVENKITSSEQWVYAEKGKNSETYPVFGETEPTGILTDTATQSFTGNVRYESYGILQSGGSFNNDGTPVPFSTCLYTATATNGGYTLSSQTEDGTTVYVHLVNSEDQNVVGFVHSTEPTDVFTITPSKYDGDWVTIENQNGTNLVLCSWGNFNGKGNNYTHYPYLALFEPDSTNTDGPFLDIGKSHRLRTAENI